MRAAAIVRWRQLASVVMAGAVLVAGSLAQGADLDYRPSFLAPKEPPRGLLLQAADALGMVRGPGANVFDGINRIQFVASGHEYGKNGVKSEIKRATVGTSYHLSAQRWDVVTAGAGGDSRRIEVVAGAEAWDEKTPGVGGAPAPATAKERARRLWMTPHGFMAQAMRLGAAAIKLGKRDGKDTLSFTLDGETFTGVLGSDHRPETIETRVAGNVLSWSYGDYKDFDHYAIQWPTHLTQGLNGRPVMELTVKEFRTGPYLVFPNPALQRNLATQ